MHKRRPTAMSTAPFIQYEQARVSLRRGALLNEDGSQMTEMQLLDWYSRCQWLNAEIIPFPIWRCRKPRRMSRALRLADDL
jgi:hypothetical protein